MKKILKRILAMILVLAMTAGAFPAATSASETGEAGKDKLVLEDEYISVTVSGKNGGFLIDTLKGNKLDKADDNKFLLYPADEFDTSYTSFRITRTNGKVEDYIFGRDYGFFGWYSSDVTLVKEGNSIVATWSVKDLTIKQTLALQDVTASQHGLVNISYDITSTKDDVADCKVRMMMDSALGYQDYAVYQLPNAAGDFNTVIGEVLLSNDKGQAYEKTFFAVNDGMNPTVTAYSLDATVNGQKLSPYQVAFGHWNNLASTVFDFVPDKTLNFTSAYNEKYMTADSAFALYFDLGALKKDTVSSVGTYYGVYSNSTVDDTERAAINFSVMPSSMELNETKDAYLCQVEGGRPGDIELQMLIENITEETVDDVTVVVKTQNNTIAYSSWYDDVKYDETENFTQVISDVLPGEELSVRAFFQLTPLAVSEYRRFEVLVYEAGEGDALTDAKLMGSREFYLLCPGELGEVIVFHSISPQILYYQGMRQLYLSGMNFGLLKDTSAYTTILRPVAGGDDVVIAAKNVLVDSGTNTMNLIVEEEMVPGAYQVIFDWNEAGREDTTSDLLQFQVSDDLTHFSPVYGIVTVEKTSDTTYQLGTYKNEAEYKKEVKDPNNTVLLEFRGNFGVRYDENGNIIEATAISVKDELGNANGTINISNCLDVEAGNVSLFIENPGADDQVINVDMDGRVYTTNARTKVWDGVCCLTSIENGEEYSLIQYKYDGSRASDIENSLANKNVITLLWPGAASDAQSLAGMLFQLEYCQFGQIATEIGETVTESTPRARVISFGGELAADFLIPSSKFTVMNNTTAMEKIQLTFAKSNYTADQLRDVQDRYAMDEQAAEDAGEGILNFQVHDVLFGGGFIGFNTTLDVGVPSYAPGYPGLEGILHLNIMPSIKSWEVGVKGVANAVWIQLEAELELKSYNGIPFPESFFFYLGGHSPGINVDGMGIFWILGMGGGLDNIYESVFCVSEIPAATLRLMGEFAVMTVLHANANMNLGLRGFDVEMTDIALKLGVLQLDIFKRMGISTYWYPKISARASVDANIFDIIEGSGYIALEENTKVDDIYWEGLIEATVHTPSFGLIPSLKIADTEMGVNTFAIWGGVKVIGVDVGVTYYWGGDVDFAFGDYEAPEPILPAGLYAIPVYADGSGQVLYMSMGTNAVLATNASIAMTMDDFDQIGAGGIDRSLEEAKITTSMDRLNHKIELGNYDGTKMVVTMLFDANSENEAQTIAMGKNGQKGIQIVAADDETLQYPLKWIDNSKPADEQQDANAVFGYDEESKQGRITISFTDAKDFAHVWKLTTERDAALTLYEMKDMAELTGATYSFQENANRMSVEWTGKILEDIDQISVQAVNEAGEVFVLYETSDYAKIIGGGMKGSASFELPAELMSGEYTIRILGSSQENCISSLVEAAEKFVYVNPKQPEMPVISEAALGGDYSIDVKVGEGNYDGYFVSVYEKDGEQWVATDFVNQWFEADENGKLPEMITVGGQQTVSYYKDKDGNVVVAQDAAGRDDLTKETKTVGLQADKTYRVGVVGYQVTDDQELVMSEETMSGEIKMTAPVQAQLEVAAKDKVTIPDASNTTENIDVVKTKDVEIEIAADMAVSGEWTLDNLQTGGTWKADKSGVITLKDVEEGEHLLKLQGTNAAGDGFLHTYRFKVDTSAPRLQMSSPADGAFYGETVSVTGMSEPNTELTVLLDGKQVKKLTVNAAGAFEIPVTMDKTKLEQTITVLAKDQAGNQAFEYEAVLVNEIIGASDVELAISLDGADVTNQTIPAGTNGNLQMSFKSGDEVVTVPANSIIGRQAEWNMEMIQGVALLEDGNFVASANAHGLLKLTYDQQTAVAVIGDNETNDAEDLNGPEIIITVKDNQWKTFLHTISFGLLFKESQEVTITAMDGESGLENVFYYVSEKAMTLDEVKALADTQWTEYSKTFSIATGADYVIYAKAVDKAGNVTYVSSDGITIEGDPVQDVFTDVYNDWYEPYVQYVYDNQLMTGIKGTLLFDPMGNVTKAQVAQVLYNMEGKPQITDGKVFKELKDVYSAEWYADAVAWAYNTGVVTGDLNAKKFFPNDDVTREQLALMMYRYAKFKEYDVSQTSDFAGLANADKVAEWSKDGVKWAVGAGLISGIDKNGIKDLAPQGTANRAQMAAILQRFCENVVK